MVIHINNKPYEVEEGRNLLDTCLSLGIDIPYFCWHPALGSVGACRLCAVKKFANESDTRGRIVMSCMEPLAPGLRISTDDPEVKEHRAAVLEWLMANHPHDCPVCDEGGECHLQDMTVMTGHNYRRYRYRKRTHNNQYLGNFINHEMNRCIQCYRCVRFYRDYAGGRDFNVFSSHDTVYFGRSGEGALQSEFSGNLVEVCPTGVFTDRTFYRHFTRKWDLQSAPSVCPHCGLGCNTLVSERYGTIRRVLNRYNEKVNGYFLCDRGRFGYEFLNSNRRTGEARGRHGAAHDAVVREIAGLMPGGRVIGIGSPRASMESNFALRKLVGPDRFFSGMQPREHELVSGIISIMRNSPAAITALRETETADAVLILGEDATNTAPMLALSLRQALKNRGAGALRAINVPRWDGSFLTKAVEENPGDLALITPHPTPLDDAATFVLREGPAGIVRLGFAVADCITNNFPPPGALSREDHEAALGIARALMGADRPLVVSGTGLMSGQVISAADAVARALLRRGKDARLFLAVPECNSVGMALLAHRTLDDALALADDRSLDAAIILENDLYRRAPRKVVDRLFNRCRRIIVIDSIMSASAERADILLPSAPYAEADGTYISHEGRAQRHYRAMNPRGNVRAAWHWLADIMRLAGNDASAAWLSTPDIINAMAEEIPGLAAMKDLCDMEDGRLPGQSIPRQPHRYSGRTSMHAREDIHEHKPDPDIDSPLAFSMEGYRGARSALVPFYWTPKWNSVQSLNRTPAWTSGRKGRDAGVRVISAAGGHPQEIKLIDGGEDAAAGEWLVVPYHRIFGSEELSACSPAIADMIKRPFLLMNEADARQAGVQPGSEAVLEVQGLSVIIPVETSGDVPHGIACYPSGMPGCEFIDLPAPGTIRRKE